MTHPGSHRLSHDHAVATARLLETAAVVVLVAYGVVCVVLAFSDSSVPGGFIDLGLVSIAAAGAGWYAPRLTGVLLVLSGAVVGPATVLAARAVGGTYASVAADRLVVVLLAAPVAAGLLMVLAARVDAHDEQPRRRLG